MLADAMPAAGGKRRRSELMAPPTDFADMEFRIADTFTSALVKHTRDEQKAVKTSAFALQTNPTDPGPQLHRIRRVDLREKVIGYDQVPTIEHYLVADPKPREILHDRRGTMGLVEPSAR